MVLKLCTFTNLFTNLFIIYYFVYIQNYSCINRDEINVILSTVLLLVSDVCIIHFQTVVSILFSYEIANLISKLNFYKLIPYPMDNC